jgi:hypothetical protein
LYFHGIWEDIGSKKVHQVIEEMAIVWQAHVLLVEYPGFGEHFGKGITLTKDIKRES